MLIRVVQGTAALCGHVAACDACGREHVAYNSCKTAPDVGVLFTSDVIRQTGLPGSEGVKWRAAGRATAR